MEEKLLRQRKHCSEKLRAAKESHLKLNNEIDRVLNSLIGDLERVNKQIQSCADYETVERLSWALEIRVLAIDNAIKDLPSELERRVQERIATVPTTEIVALNETASDSASYASCRSQQNSDFNAFSTPQLKSRDDVVAPRSPTLEEIGNLLETLDGGGPSTVCPAPPGRQTEIPLQAIAEGTRLKRKKVVYSLGPGCFFITHGDAKMVRAKIDEIKSCSSSLRTIDPECVPCPAIAYSYQYREYYRANVRHRKGTEELLVEYCDYGNEETLPVESVFEISPDLASIPALAVGCTLVNPEGPLQSIRFSENAKKAFNKLIEQRINIHFIFSIEKNKYAVAATLTDGRNLLPLLETSPSASVSSAYHSFHRVPSHSTSNQKSGPTISVSNQRQGPVISAYNQNPLRHPTQSKAYHNPTPKSFAASTSYSTSRDQISDAYSQMRQSTGSASTNPVRAGSTGAMPKTHNQSMPRFLGRGRVKPSGQPLVSPSSQPIIEPCFVDRAHREKMTSWIDKGDFSQLPSPSICGGSDPLSPTSHQDGRLSPTFSDITSISRRPQTYSFLDQLRGGRESPLPRVNPLLGLEPDPEFQAQSSPPREVSHTFIKASELMKRPLFEPNSEIQFIFHKVKAIDDFTIRIADEDELRLFDEIESYVQTSKPSPCNPKQRIPDGSLVLAYHEKYQQWCRAIVNCFDPESEKTFLSLIDYAENGFFPLSLLTPLPRSFLSPPIIIQACLAGVTAVLQVSHDTFVDITEKYFTDGQGDIQLINGRVTSHNEELLELEIIIHDDERWTTINEQLISHGLCIPKVEQRTPSSEHLDETDEPFDETFARTPLEATRGYDPTHDVCWHFEKYGNCKYGASCKYSHDLTLLREGQEEVFTELRPRNEPLPEHSSEIEIVHVNNPKNFFFRFKHPMNGKPQSSVSHACLDKAMQDHYKYNFENFRPRCLPAIGEIMIGRSGQSFFRIRILDDAEDEELQRFQAFMIDSGKETAVRFDNLFRIADQKFLYPSDVHNACLTGVVPTSESGCWESDATGTFIQILENSSLLRAQVEDELEDGKLIVNLHYKDENGRMESVASALINSDLATSSR